MASADLGVAADEGWKGLLTKLVVLTSPSFEARATSGFDICPLAYHGCFLAKNKNIFDYTCDGRHDVCPTKDMIILMYMLGETD